MAFWTCYANRDSKEQMHEFDECTVCVLGEYVKMFDSVGYILKPGYEVLI